MTTFVRSQNQLQRIFVIILFGLILTEVVIFAPQDVNLQIENPLKEEKISHAELEQKMRGVHLLETKEGERLWELWSDEALSLKEKATWLLDKVKVRFFAQDGLSYIVHGQKGRILIESKDVEISGAVTLESSNGYVYRTEELVYQSETKSFETSGRVEVQGPQEKGRAPLFFMGHGLKANLGDHKMKILKDVTVKKQLETGQQFHLKSNSAVLSGVSKEANFEGDVVIDVGNTRITGPTAKFEFGEGRESIQAIAVEGGIRVSDPQRWATAETAYLLFQQDSFILRGHPRVIQNNHELQGEEIVFLNSGSEIIVQKARARFDEKDKDLKRK